VERTILYGIRSGHPKSRNVTDMPALVRSGQITPADARDAVEYLQGLSGRPHDETAAARGRAIYYNKGNCYDCHANDARGVADYGTPALTGPVYLYGGDRESLYQSILNGRHGQSPAWVNVLSPLQIRALTLYLVGAPSGARAGN
jgi:cytochrome c oxidase cbb3-type subunit III